MLETPPFALPLKRLRETEHLLAFHHPRPSSPFYVILLALGDIRTLAGLSPDDPFVCDLAEAVQSLVLEYYLPAYRLVVNGGDSRETPRLHFHLISG